MPAQTPDAVARVIAAAAERGLRIEVVETAGSRSAEDAAKAVGTIPARIVKSMVFRGVATGTAYLILVSGTNRVDETAIAAEIGEAVERPDADFVREATGFAIGGVSPFGARQPLATFMDESLFAHPTVFAAAGTPRHVFETVPLQLRSATLARLVRLG